MIPKYINTQDGKVCVKVFSWINFISYRIDKHSLIYILKLTSAKYPRLLSCGYFSKSDKEIVLADIGDVELRFLHERGHAERLNHTWKIGYVMNPLGFLRGKKVI
ncbi:hypothetical protein KAR91_59660 [Candidatus Pacearchaeota archaeon]|nr:hypothetical protein [Candidatus Pacearchaeota archaeon]